MPSSSSWPSSPESFLSQKKPADRDARDMQAVYADTCVVKRLSAVQPGALKLARRYGDALVCVRYRHDRQGRVRYTTVELVVDHAPIASRAPLDELVMVHIGFKDTRRHQLASANGARWDSKQCLWRMTRQVARNLRLIGKIVKTAR